MTGCEVWRSCKERWREDCWFNCEGIEGVCEVCEGICVPICVKGVVAFNCKVDCAKGCTGGCIGGCIADCATAVVGSIV